MSEPLPPHLKAYLEAFDGFLRSSNDTEARVHRRRMDRALRLAGISPERDKRASLMEVPDRLLQAAGGIPLKDAA